jgi:hypothetical protein
MYCNFNFYNLVLPTPSRSEARVVSFLWSWSLSPKATCFGGFPSSSNPMRGWFSSRQGLSFSSLIFPSAKSIQDLFLVFPCSAEKSTKVIAAVRLVVLILVAVTLHSSVLISGFPVCVQPPFCSGFFHAKSSVSAAVRSTQWQGQSPRHRSARALLLLLAFSRSGLGVAPVQRPVFLASAAKCLLVPVAPGQLALQSVRSRGQLSPPLALGLRVRVRRCRSFFCSKAA